MKNRQLKQLLRLCMGLVLVLSLVAGCQGGPNSQSSQRKEGPRAAGVEEDGQSGVLEGMQAQLPIIRFVETTRRAFSLTFSGLGDAATVGAILDELDNYQIKATFFVPGARVEEEPELARQIAARGHELQSSGYHKMDLRELSYAEVFDQIKKGKEALANVTGITPVLYRTKSGDFNDTIVQAAADNGMRGLVVYNINPRDWDGKSALEIGNYVRRFMKRGGIVALNTDMDGQVAGSIKHIAEAARAISYDMVTLGDLLSTEKKRLPLEQIPGYDAAKMNLEMAGKAKYQIIQKGPKGKRQIALTLDDWGSDETLTNFLDLLDRYQVKATFFLRANGVQENPNMAQAIAEAGHEVASHTFSHPDLTELTASEIQEEVVKSHRVITEAIQKKPLMMIRPPKGHVNKKVGRAIGATGYKKIALFDVTAYDWDVNNDAATITRKVVEQSVDGSIVLLHILDNLHTLEALPSIIDTLRGKGYELVTLSELLRKK